VKRREEIARKGRKKEVMPRGEGIQKISVSEAARFEIWAVAQEENS
jgi:hypothetical protein